MKIGSKIKIPSNLKVDPLNKKGQTGTLISDRLGIYTIRFADGMEGRFFANVWKKYAKGGKIKEANQKNIIKSDYSNNDDISKENADMVRNQNTQIRHHTEELKSVLKAGAKVPAWVVAKVNRSANDISDATHYLEGETKMEKGGAVKKGSKIKYEGKEGKILNKKGDMYFAEIENYYPNGDTLFQVVRDGEFERMAKGGAVKNFKVGDRVIFARNGKWFVGNRENFKKGEITKIENISGSNLYTIEFRNKFGTLIDTQLTSNTKEIEINEDVNDNERMAKGGIVKYYTKDDSYRLSRPSGSIEKDILERVVFKESVTEELFVGNFGWRTTQGKIGDGYLYKLGEYDQNLIKDLKLKSGEKVFRYFNRMSAIGGMTPLIKINLEKGLIYFLKDNDNDDIIFETRGTPTMWIGIIEDKMAKGGNVDSYSNWEYDVFDEISNTLDITFSDAQGIVMANEFYLAQSWGKGLDAKETASLILEKSKMAKGGKLEERKYSSKGWSHKNKK